MAATYRIASVALRTGLTPDTIRAWERRYRVVTPERTSGGERRYSEADVEKLQLVRAAVELGHAVSYVARLPDSEIAAIVEASRPDAASDLERAATRRTIADVLDALREYDLAAAAGLLNSAAVFFAPHTLIIDVLSPLMRTIGDEWEAGRFSIAQEHFASHLVEGVVASLMRVKEPASGRTMLFLTPPSETHELGLHLAAALAASRGVRPIVLGANVPLGEAIEAARGSNASAIVVGATRADDSGSLVSYASHLRNGLPASVAVYLGGAAVTCIEPDDLASGIRVVDSLASFYRALEGASK